MLFTHDSAAGLADGTITLTFRTWSKPQAKPGGLYRTCGLLLEVKSVSRTEAESITEADAIRAGYASTEALRDKLRIQETNAAVWRVEFRCLGEDDRIARRNDGTPDDEKLQKIRARLDRMDGMAAAGPWTLRTLRLIAENPGVVSTVLAERMQMDRPDFKINVRKLKEIGLTESLEVGYRLSALGKAFLAAAGK